MNDVIILLFYQKNRKGQWIKLDKLIEIWTYNEQPYFCFAIAIYKGNEFEIV